RRIETKPAKLDCKRTSGSSGSHHRIVYRTVPSAGSLRMFDVVLFQPEIPPNTGNIIRLCANTGSRLHLIRPLGFDIGEKAVRRAGMDYAELASVRVWNGLEECLRALHPARWFAVSTRGTRRYDEVRFQPNDVFVFGPETRGLQIGRASGRERVEIAVVE